MEDEKIYNIVFLGDSNIGTKTALIKRLISNEFQENTISTIGIDYIIKKIELKNGKIITLKLVDTAGIIQIAS
mgnify:CR=1 FL=1